MGKFIYAVYGTPDNSKSPAESPRLGTVEIEVCNQGAAMLEARKMYPNAKYVYLEKMTGRFDAEQLRIAQDWEPRVYAAWLKG